MTLDSVRPRQYPGSRERILRPLHLRQRVLKAAGHGGGEIDKGKAQGRDENVPDLPQRDPDQP